MLNDIIIINTYLVRTHAGSRPCLLTCALSRSDRHVRALLLCAGLIVLCCACGRCSATCCGSRSLAFVCCCDVRRSRRCNNKRVEPGTGINYKYDTKIEGPQKTKYPEKHQNKPEKITKSNRKRMEQR